MIYRRGWAVVVVAAFVTLAAAVEPEVVEERDGVAVRVQFPAPALDAAPGRGYATPRLAGLASPERAGQPVLPEWSRVIAVPLGATPRLEVVRADERALPGNLPPAVVRFDAALGRYVPRPWTAGTDYPDAARVAVRLEEIGIVRHVRLARLVIRPVRFLPDSASWTSTPVVELRVRFDGTVDTTAPAASSDPTDARVASLTLNPSAVPSATIDRDAIDDGIPVAEPSVMPPVRIRVREDGLYEITRDDLLGAGADPAGIDTATFVLTTRGVEVPIDLVDGGDGSFDAGDVFRFWGAQLDSEETFDNVYRLTAGVRPGLRMATRDVTPAAAPVPPHFENAAYHEVDFLYWGAVTPEAGTPWYWNRVSSVNASIPTFQDFPVTVTNRSGDAGLTARLEVRIQSRRETPGPSPNHRVRVYLNGNLVEERSWTGLLGQTLGGDVPQSWVLEGANTVRVEAPAGLPISIQEEWIDWIRLSYRDRYAAESDYLWFTADDATTRKFEISGFSAGNLAGYDVADPLAPRRLTGIAAVADGPAFRAELSNLAGSAPGPFVVLRAGAGRRPFAVEGGLSPNLRAQAPSGADLLIVTHENFASAVQTLATHRAAQGLRVQVATLSEVYEEFNDGIRDTEGIRNFVRWAFANYAPPAPSYLLIVGDSTYDLRDVKGEGDTYVPARFAIEPDVGHVPTDTWFGTVSGTDEVPDLAVGRITARTAADVSNYVDKILAYENAPPTAELNSKMLYVADNDDEQFEGILEGVIAGLQPPAMESRRVYLDEYPSGSAAKADIKAAIESGALFTTYMGHGTRTGWAAEGMWGNSDVAALAGNGRLTFVLALNCVNGYFTNLDFEAYSLSEQWLRDPSRGGVGNWAPSALGTLFNYDVLTDRFYQDVFVDGQNRLGHAAWDALLDAHLIDNVPLQYVREMTYFGDPAALVPLDSDRDGALDAAETASGTNRLDADTDDDGVTDGVDPNGLDPDTDDDGLPDGLERGVAAPPAGTDVARGWFLADANPASTTNPRARDTDGGGAPDGAEDRNRTGAIDAGETDPNLAVDDPVCTPAAPSEVAGLTIAKSGGDVVLNWTGQTGADPCVLYRVYIADDTVRPQTFAAFRYAGTTTLPTFRHIGAATDGRRYSYLVTATGPVAGEGPLGHYGR